MNRKTSLLLAGLALGVTSSAQPVFAYEAKPMTDATCVKLRDQLKDAIASHQKSDRLAEAEYWGEEGRSFCLTDDPHTGSDKYRQALQTLGVKPAA